MSPASADHDPTMSVLALELGDTLGDAVDAEVVGEALAPSVPEPEQAATKPVSASASAGINQDERERNRGDAVEFCGVMDWIVRETAVPDLLSHRSGRSRANDSRSARTSLGNGAAPRDAMLVLIAR